MRIQAAHSKEVAPIPLLRSNLKSNRGAAAIASALSDNRRVQAPSGTHSNGTGVIGNGIDLMRAPELNRVAGIYRYGTRTNRRSMRDLRTTAHARW